MSKLWACSRDDRRILQSGNGDAVRIQTLRHPIRFLPEFTDGDQRFAHFSVAMESASIGQRKDEMANASRSEQDK
jgi:hypothetical protein